MRLIFILLVCLSISVHAQPESYEKKIESMIDIGNPSASKLLADNVLSMNYAYGLPAIDLPLHVVKSGNLQLQISLNYNASGVKVDQAPSWIGLGWNMLAGGSISRKVNGIRDELAPAGYIQRKNSLPEYRPDISVLNGLTTTYQTSTTIENDFAQPSYIADAGPDEFSFSFNGNYGKFWFDEDGNVVTDSKYHIEYIMDDRNAPNQCCGEYFARITIIVEDGTKYIFEETDYQTTVTGFIYNPSSSVLGESDITWHLKEIRSADGASKINFEYDSEVFRGLHEYYETSERYRLVRTTGSSSICDYYHSGPTTRVEQELIFLKKIITDTEEVEFDVQPVSSRFMEQALSSITVKNKINNTEWGYDLTHQFVAFGGNDKFLLQAVNKTNSEESIEWYQFQYNTTPIPFATPSQNDDSEAGVDHWGYYNGPLSPYTSRLPIIGQPIIRQNSTTVTGIDRTPNTSYMKAWSLEKITLPTKGWIDLEMEANDYSYINSTQVLNEKRIGGGLRLKRMTYYDGIDVANNVIKEYEYVSSADSTLSSGVIVFEPTYYYYFDNGDFNADLWMSHSILPTDIIYSQVTEIASDGSSTTYTFSTSREYPPTAAPDEKKIIIHAVIGTEKFKLDNTSNPFLISDEYNEHMRGLLTKKSQKNGSGQLVQETSYTYQSFPIDSLLIIRSNPFGFNPITCPVAPTAINFTLVTSIQIARAERIEEEIVVFGLPVTSESLTITKGITYNSRFLPAEITMDRSDGKITKSIIKYPDDYLASAMGGVIFDLVDKRRAYGLPVEQIELIDDKVVSGTVFEYDDLARVSKVYGLKLSSPLNFTGSYFNASNHISQPSYYLVDLTIAYNSATKRIAEILRRGHRTSFLWGYENNSLPVAKAENASENQIFSTSFESDGVLDASSRSGIKCFHGDYTFIPPSGFTPDVNSILSYWYWDVDKWKPKSISYSGTITLSDGTKIDDVRIFPSAATMTTYSFDSPTGVSEIIDINNSKTSFEYDLFGRLKLSRDNSNNLLSWIQYHYKQ